MLIFTPQICVSKNEGKNCKSFVGFSSPQAPNCIWNKPNLFVNTSFCSDFSQYAIVFYQSLINAVLLTPERGPDVQVNVLEDYIIFLIWTAWLLLDFYLKQKERHSVTFTENVSFSPFHVGIWSSYSELNKFKISKYLFFQK